MSDLSDLEPYATTESQVNILRAIMQAGTNRAAARLLGLNPSTVDRSIIRLRALAAKAGHAPGHFDSGVAPGYVMGKVTIHRKDGVVQQTWERQMPDDEAREAAIREGFEAMAAELPRVDAKRSSYVGSEYSDKLLNLFTITDYHMGMLAWHKETGADWDLKIAEDMLYRMFSRQLEGAPAARVAIINQLGDFLHTDGLKAVTPEHGHLLDADGRFPKIVAATVRVLRRIVDMALQTHETVHVVMAEGNHDMVSSIWLRTMFSALYEDEPRVTVDNSASPYYRYVHGLNLLGFHHGHLSRNQSLPALFAAKFRQEWGATTRAYIHTGHRHHQHTQEFPGALVVQHATLAAPDAYAARGGWMSERQARRITYHMSFGEVGSEVVTPEMLVDN